MPGEDSVLASLDDGIARIVLNRPRRFNALDGEMIALLDEALSRFAGDEAVRALVLLGGRRAFCFGADLAGLPGGDALASTLDALLPRFQSVIRRVAEFPVPTIAAISGFATGAGLDLALACDLRIATESSKLGVAFLRMGLVPDGGGTWRLPRLVGLGRAFDLVYGSDAVTAERAEAIGLVNRVVAPDRLEEAALGLARTIGSLPPAAVRAAKRLLLDDLGRDFPSSLLAEAREQTVLFRSPEFAAAVAALRR